ncbi:dienelactone hydrolase family protein [Microvirga subterranea]|uniref:Dienelactone hydrolase n=1 Tax=Microvirga subterranea TaxID=186651 RepID=A0A370HVQ9_9HYPH|nr:dienelactone hydrolase family protein [Microvirga subterranea]RDI62603.1 dienelactone hydrolase [Microvirga subterranea]
MSISRRNLLIGAALAASPSIHAQEGKPSLMPLMEQRQSFRSGGRAIAVETFQEGGSAPRPAVLMLHGADGLGGHGQYREGARSVARAGYQVHLVHYLDRTGERRASFSTLFQNFQPWMETVHDALAWASGHDGADPKRIGIVGISLGAALGLAVSSAEPRIRALVNYFGPLPQGAIAKDARLPPTLVLHGGMDPIVPVSNAYAIEALLRQQNVPHEVKIYPEQAHGFRGEAERDATRRSLAFLQRHLGSGQADGSTALPMNG